MRVQLLSAAFTAASALNNGFTLPILGYGTWNDCSSYRDNGPDGWCWDAEGHVKNVTRYLIDSGLAALGYHYINVDEGWLSGRYPNGTLYEDRDKFPSGMQALGQWIHSQEVAPGVSMKYGLYTCRGTCQCGTGTYSGPGSQGYEAEDSAWMIEYAGADFVKIDSCCGDQVREHAYSQYALWRDAINASASRRPGAAPVWFNLCGWAEWYGPPDTTRGYAGGQSLGNSFRIAVDGSGWEPLTNCINTMAAVGQYSGPGGWADPDLLIGPQCYVGGQTDVQARTQFALWALFPANLIISQNVLAWSPYALETYSNAEVIAINQDTLMRPAERLVGSDMRFPCSGDRQVATTVAASCNASDPYQAWDWHPDTGMISNRALGGPTTAVLDNVTCENYEGAAVAVFPPFDSPCSGWNQRWTYDNASSTIVNHYNGNCLDVYDLTGPQVDTWPCNGCSCQHWSWNSSTGALYTADGGPGYPSLCLAAVPMPPQEPQCTNVWGRQLSAGSFSLIFVNNGYSDLALTCDTACFTALGVPPSVSALTVRDLWAHETVATLTPSFTFTTPTPVPASGGSAMYKLTPATTSVE